MHLSKIRIRNYRLLNDAELDVDLKTTLIVGRNNTAKTSCITCVGTVLKGNNFSFDDYPIEKRKVLYELLSKFMQKQITYEEFCEQLPVIAVEFWVDYSAEGMEDSLGALSPFIIDVDMDTTVAKICVEYILKMEDTTLWNMFETCFYKEGKFSFDEEEVREKVGSVFTKMFGINIFAVNPKNSEDRQLKTYKELSELFPFYVVPAERILGEDGEGEHNSLGKLITSFFDVSEEDIDPEVLDEVRELRKLVEDSNKNVQRRSDELLSRVVHNAVGFGYPNGEELQLGVMTQLKIDDQIKNKTKLSYMASASSESLPSTHNGLGYKNLIKMEFLLASFAKEVEKYGASLPLLFIEEPESHMHPQMQHTFAEYLETFLGKISNVNIQTFLTSHSAHIANTMDFSKIRYAQKTIDGVIYKNLHSFVESNPDNADFIKKYLTLSRCDLFFADKAILIEGAAERLLLPDMINKCDEEGLFEPLEYKLPAQYYALIEIGGAYAHKFVPFMEFLGIPTLILTDIDSVGDNKKKALVSEGKTSSNATIKWWYKKVNSIPKSKEVTLLEIVDLSEDKKTFNKCHIEYQISENGLCGRSLEEAIKNVNRNYYDLDETSATESNLEFDENSKTDFALDLIYKNSEYQVPLYIKNGLKWLNEQKVLE